MQLAKEIGSGMDRQGAAIAAGPPGAMPRLLRWLLTGGRQSGDREGWRRAVAAAVAVFLASLVYYGWCMFPGLGGELNAGDSTKIQILGHTPIMLHGPGYPFVLMLGAGVRALGLPLPPWWTMTFALAVVPAAIANAVALLIVYHLTRHIRTAVAAALLLGTSSLMAIQATEAEVYPLALAFILTTVFLLLLFVESRRIGFFVAACAVYAASFGNHLMMIMLLPVFIWLTVLHFRLILRPRPMAAIAFFILLGASQYLYLAYTAYSPHTAYSEYMPLPPPPMELVEYIRGTYFADLYGSGLDSTRTLEDLVFTLRSAHPWVSAPLIVVGIALFLAGCRRRDAAWRGLALVYGAALSFTPFMLWYGAYDIRAFHLPVLGPLLVAVVATSAWWLARRPVFRDAVATLLLVVGIVRGEHVATLLQDREPLFDGLKPTIRQMVADAPVEHPLFVMPYGLRMAALYYELSGELPRSPSYRVWWRAVPEVKHLAEVGGVVVPTDGFQFVQWVEHERPELKCTTREVPLQERRWPAYAFVCQSDSEPPPGGATFKVSAPTIGQHR